jgi:hypothetical protein
LKDASKMTDQLKKFQKMLAKLSPDDQREIAPLLIEFVKRFSELKERGCVEVNDSSSRSFSISIGRSWSTSHD